MSLAVVLIESRYDYLPIWERHAKFLPEDSFLYLITYIKSVPEYNKLLCSKDFWESIDTENVLIIQHDSNILRTGIEEFYKFDYIGAPIKWIPFPAMNGGLSFRKKSAMLKVIENVPYYGNNEDLYFTGGLNLIGGKLPTLEEAKLFSCETIFNLNSFGYHAIERYLTTDQVNQIKKQYEIFK